MSKDKAFKASVHITEEELREFVVARLSIKNPSEMEHTIKAVVMEVVEKQFKVKTEAALELALNEVMSKLLTDGLKVPGPTYGSYVNMTLGGYIAKKLDETSSKGYNQPQRSKLDHMIVETLETWGREELNKLIKAHQHKIEERLNSMVVEAVAAKLKL